MSDYYYAFTPEGTIVLETKANNEKQCITKILNCLAGTYKDWDEMQIRGYTIEQLDLSW